MKQTREAKNGLSPLRTIRAHSFFILFFAKFCESFAKFLAFFAKLSTGSFLVHFHKLQIYGVK